MKDVNQLVSRQVGRWQAEKKALVEAGHDLAVEHPARLKPVITVSRQEGCRGTEFAKILAHELRYGLFDREIIEYISEHMGVCSELVESLDETGRSALEQWVDGLLHQQAFAGDDYLRGLGEVIKTAAIQGGVVILGRGANYLLRDTNAFHVRLVASLETRVKNMVDIEGFTEERARELIDRKDRERKQFIKKYFHQNIDDPEFYDVIVNMSNVNLDPAVKIVLTCLRAKGFYMEDTGGDKRKQVR